MAQAHDWTSLRLGKLIGVTDCNQCGLVLLPSVHNGFKCKSCPFVIHQRCLSEGKRINPCSNIEQENLQSNTIFAGLLEKVVLKPKVRKERRSSNFALSKQVNYWFTLTQFGVLYYSREEKKMKQIGAYFLKDYDIVKEDEKTIQLKKKNAKHIDPITLSSNETEDIDNWFNLLVGAQDLQSIPLNLEKKDSTWYNLLTVKISEGKNFPAMDISGTSDCYCIITCEHEFGRTQTIWKNNKNPFWAETFDFDICDPESATLTVYVLDEDCIQTDEVIGAVFIKGLADLTSKKTTKWYPLQKCIQLATGSLRINIKRTTNELYVRLISGKNLPSADPNGKSDPYVRLLLDKQKKKSKTIKKTLNPVFNEEFVFTLDSNTPTTLDILVYDWDLLVNDDFLGKIEIDFSDFPIDQEIEELYLLKPRESKEQIEQYNKKHEGDALGEIRLETSIIRRSVHTMPCYTPLFDLLVSPGIPSIFLIAQVIMDKGGFASILVKIFDLHSKSVYLANALTDHEIEHTPNPDIIFRGNTLVTKTIDSLMKLTGKLYMNAVIGPILSTTCKKKSKALEVDPLKIEKSQSISKNGKNLRTLCQSILDRIFDSVEECPPIMAVLLYNIRSKVETTYEQAQIRIVKYTSVSAFIFLRFFCPAIINPKLFGFVEKLSSSASRTCTLLAKLTQNLANLVHFGEKESFMKGFNDFIDENIPKMKLFIDKLCERGNKYKATKFEPTRSDIWLAKELAMAAIHIKTCQEKWQDEQNPNAVNLVKALDLIAEADNSVGDNSME